MLTDSPYNSENAPIVGKEYAAIMFVSVKGHLGRLPSSIDPNDLQVQHVAMDRNFREISLMRENSTGKKRLYGRSLSGTVGG